MIFSSDQNHSTGLNYSIVVELSRDADQMLQQQSRNRGHNVRSTALQGQNRQLMTMEIKTHDC
jgi:uncharacterized protein YebE (UPF0316 family)